MTLDGIPRNEIALLLKPFSIENYCVASTVMRVMYAEWGALDLAKSILGSHVRV